MRLRHRGQYIILTILLFVLIVCDLCLGVVRIPVTELFSAFVGHGSSEVVERILWGYRLPKLATALCVGIALPTSGLLMQTIFRNPLAGPFVLGISSGSTLGAALVIVLGGSVIFFSAPLTIALAACMGALGVLFLVLLVNLRIRQANTLLIFGLMLSALLSSVVIILQYISDERALRLFTLWTLGSFSAVSGSALQILTLSVFLGWGVAWVSLRPLHLLQLGDRTARSLGLSIRTTYLLLFVATTLLAGVTTAFCGPIGFVGIAVPHLARRIFRTAKQGILLFGTPLLGMVFLIAADLLSSVLGRLEVLPINAITALLSLPLIFHLLFVGRRAHD